MTDNEGVTRTGGTSMPQADAAQAAHEPAGRLNANGEHFPGKWAQDHAGNATNDPRILFQ